MNDKNKFSVAELIKNNIIEKPYDGNHGAIHPKGDDFIDSGIPFIMASDVENGRVDLKNCKFISKKQADSLRKGFAVEGDVLLTHKASIGRTAVVPHIDFPYIMLTPQVTYYRIKNKKVLNNLYLKYYFDSRPFQEVLGAMAGAGSTRAYLGIVGQQDLPIEFPDISTQQKIAAVLSALDAKIELNQRINAELESMAKTLYDYWFVQFEFPNEKGKPYKSAGGKMVWNEELKRDVPAGWEKGVLLDIGTITGGSTPSREVEEYFNVNGMAWITPKDLSLNTGNKFITKGETGVSEKGLKSASLNIMPKGTILLSSRAPIGYMAISREEVTTTQGFKSFVPDKGYSIPYIYYTVKNAIPTIINHSSGSTFKEISSSVLKEISICLPPVSVTENFGKTVNAIFERQNILELESQTLTEVRDWLLSMLMNGQVKVS